MAISSILSDPKQLLRQLGANPCKIGDMILDVVVKEAPEWSWTTTQFKTQSGFTGSDVRLKNPDRLVIDCVFVDKSYGAKDLTSALINGEGFVPETWRDKYQKFKELVNSEDILTATIGLDAFPSMAVKSVSMVRDEQRAGYLSFTVILEEIFVVDTDFEDIDTSLMPKEEEEPVKKKKRNSGHSDDKKTEPKKATEPERHSTLYSMTYGG